MGKINVNLKDAKELELAPEGEYQLRIIKAEDGESKKGNEMTTLTIAFDEHPEWAPFKHWVLYPTMDMEDGQRNMRMIEIKRLLTCFGVPFDEDGFDSEDLIGSTGKSLVIQEESDNDDNVYNRLRLPRLRKSDEKSSRIRR